MNQPKILIVEDEGVVAADIEQCLRKLGYRVVASAATAVSAIRKAVENEPDLVLMDIRLKGPVDGVDAAAALHERLGIPVVFLTAYADAEILERAKKTSPAGYILKPFDERSLRSAVEIALYKHPQQQRLIENERRLVMALRSINEAVILTDAGGAVTLMNRPAEALTGWTQEEAAGRPVKDVFVTVHAARGSLLGDPVGRALREGVSLGLGDRRVLVSRQGGETWIRGSAAPLRNGEGETVGAALVFHAADLERIDTCCAFRSLESSRLETAGRLAGSIAADLGHTFSRIAAHGQALEARLGREPAARPEIAGLLEAAAHGSRLAGQLSRYVERRLPRPSVIELNQIITGLDRLLACVAGERVQILTELDPMAGCVVADRGHLEHVVLNLAAAARGMMPEGGKLTIATRGVELAPGAIGDLAELAPGPYGVLSLSFTGGAETGDSEPATLDLAEMLALAGGRLLTRCEPGRLTTHEIYLPAAGNDCSG
jgi:two-component system cell cycle sensor histidine kinase/response regulator CckA